MSGCPLVVATVSCEANIAVISEKVVIPTNIHNTENKRAHPDLGILSPYPTVVIETKLHL